TTQTQQPHCAFHERISPPYYCLSSPCSRSTTQAAHKAANTQFRQHTHSAVCDLGGELLEQRAGLLEGQLVLARSRGRLAPRLSKPIAIAIARTVSRRDWRR